MNIESIDELQEMLRGHSYIADRGLATAVKHRCPSIYGDFRMRQPHARLGEAEEVAQAVVWLLSDQSSYTNGAALTIDGGFTAQ